MRTQYNSSGSCPADNPEEKVEHILSRSIPNGNYLKIGLSFRLERDNHETDEDVDHEEGEDDDVDEVEHEDNGPIAFLWSHVSFVGVDGNVENPENIDQLLIAAELFSPRPSFKSGGNEKSEHPADDIVVMEVVLQPLSVLDFLNIGNVKEIVQLQHILLPVC